MRHSSLLPLALGAALGLGVSFAAHAADPPQAATGGNLKKIAAGADPVIAAAGDISCDPADANYHGGAGTATACRMRATSDLLVGRGLSAVLILGDNQYEDGALAKYQAAYEPTWGRLKAITHPAPGNHEYNSGGAGYFKYFGAAAGTPGQGWYSFDLGAWHLIALNSNCAAVGGCGAGSPQEKWLAADLAAHPGRCTLAYWHHPRFSSGSHGSDPMTAAFWEDLYAAGADVVLNGHEHVYERFARQTPAGGGNPARGIRQFTVGTGGKNHTAFGAPLPTSAARSASTFGALELTLHPNGYDWRFLADGGGFADSGSGLCHSALPSPAASYYTVTPCRVADTRAPEGPAGGPALAAGVARTFQIGGTCGVPVDAVAAAANVTVVGAGSSGSLTAFPAGGALPVASVVSFRPGIARAASAVLPLGVDGGVAVQCTMPSGTADLILDVAGYFQ